MIPLVLVFVEERHLHFAGGEEVWIYFTCESAGDQHIWVYS